MATHKILVTGDFWHTDFQKVVSKFDVPVTLVPFDKVETVVDQRYDLVVLAQSRRDQFLPAEVEELIANIARRREATRAAEARADALQAKSDELRKENAKLQDLLAKERYRIKHLIRAIEAK